jgi:hypothetical protein
MHSELLNLWLFAAAIAKMLLMTGLGPAILLGAIFVRCPFPFCVSPELHEDDHDVRVPIERFTPFREQAELFKSSGGGQLALSGKVSSSATVSSATSPLRKKMRRHA